ncbi:MAG: VOC family protein [Maritimibacter sp.]|nr:VOC family protein [Maritimibacter sp.]
MISHVTLGIGDIDAAMTFYRQLMEGLGWEEKFATRRSPPGPWAGFHPAGSDRPLLILAHPDCPHSLATPGGGAEVAFALATPAAVTAAHATGLALGATDAGAPGPGYPAAAFTARLRDPWGNLLVLTCPGAGTGDARG